HVGASVFAWRVMRMRERRRRVALTTEQAVAVLSDVLFQRRMLMLFSWRPITESDRAQVASVLALSFFAVLGACTDTVAPSGHPGIPPIAAIQECPPDQPDCNNVGP